MAAPLVIEEIRAIVGEHGRLPVDISTVGDDEDLFLAGLTSHATVSLMLALESRFDLEFPDQLLRRKSFESMSAIARVIAKLLEGQPA
jgi:acyl carrier protein